MATSPKPSTNSLLEEQLLKNASLVEQQLIKDLILKDIQEEVEILNKKKVKQETSLIKAWIIPFLTILGIFGSAYIVFFTDRLQSKEDKNTAIKAKNDAEIILATTKLEKDNKLQVMQGIDLLTRNYELKQETEKLDDKKKGLKFENANLISSNEFLKQNLKKANDQQNKLEHQSSMLAEKIGELNISRDSLQKAKDFGIFSYSLWLIKTNKLTARFNAVDVLLSGVKYNKEFQDRIIDSLNSYSNLPIDEIFGTTNFILYFGTEDIRYKQKILNEIKNNFKKSMTSIHYNQLFYSELWTDEERKEIIKTIMNVSTANLNNKEKAFLLEAVANIDNVREDISLYKVDFDSFLKYIKVAKEVSLDNNYYIPIMKYLTIICPQIFLAKKYSSILSLKETFGPMFNNKKFYNDLDINDFALLILDGFYSNNKVSKFVSLIEDHIDNSNKKTIRLTDYIKVTNEILLFWTNFFDGYYIDPSTLKSKLDKEIF